MVDDLIAWLDAARPIEFAALIVLVVAAALILDRSSARPDFPVKGLYAEAGLGVAMRLAATIPAGLGGVIMLGFVGRVAAFVGVTVLAILRPARNLAGRRLWVAAIAVPVVALLTDWIVGAEFVLDDRSFSVHHRIFLFLGVTALFVAPRLDVDNVVRLAKTVLGGALALSLATVLAGLPEAGSPVGTFLPGVTERASGVFDHPNHLGPATVLYLILEHIRPSRLLLRLGGSGLAIVLLILSQSKTSWVAAVAVGLVLFASRWEPRQALATSAILVAVAAPVVLLFGVETGDIVDDIPIAHVDTLTGRTDLWATGIELWRESPLLGHGSGVFLEVARRSGEGWRAQAHNEYVQALAENGLVGLTTVVVYLVVLVRVAVRHVLVSRNGSLAIVALLLLQTLTEVHLVAFDLPHMTALALLLGWERQAADEWGRVSGGSASVPRPLRRMAPPGPAA